MKILDFKHGVHGLLAQIGFDHLRVRAHFRRRAFGDLHAVIEHGDALADAHDDLHVVLDQQHGDLKLVLDEADEPRQLHLLGRVHAGGGFVEQQQLRLRGQRADDLQPPLVAVGQALGRLVAEACRGRRFPAVP